MLPSLIPFSFSTAQFLGSYCICASQDVQDHQPEAVYVAFLAELLGVDILRELWMRLLALAHVSPDLDSPGELGEAVLGQVCGEVGLDHDV